MNVVMPGEGRQETRLTKTVSSLTLTVSLTSPAGRALSSPGVPHPRLALHGGHRAPHSLPQRVCALSVPAHRSRRLTAGANAQLFPGQEQRGAGGGYKCRAWAAIAVPQLHAPRRRGRAQRAQRRGRPGGRQRAPAERREPEREGRLWRVKSLRSRFATHALGRGATHGPRDRLPPPRQRTQQRPAHDAALWHLVPACERGPTHGVRGAGVDPESAYGGRPGVPD